MRSRASGEDGMRIPTVVNGGGVTSGARGRGRGGERGESGDRARIAGLEGSRLKGWGRRCHLSCRLWWLSHLWCGRCCETKESRSEFVVEEEPSVGPEIRHVRLVDCLKVAALRCRYHVQHRSEWRRHLDRTLSLLGRRLVLRMFEDCEQLPVSD